jgi:hypothetical protein
MSSPGTATDRWFRCAAAAIAVAAAIACAVRIDGVVDGEHFFRQAHVAANVDHMVRDGLFTVPRAWNDDLFLRLYDFPLYQGLAAMLVHATGDGSALAAELVSLACLAAACWLLVDVARRLGLDRWSALAACAFVALSPLARFWFTAPLPDTLGLVLSLAVLSAWLRGGVPVAAAAALTAALVKPPVLLPVVLALLWHGAVARDATRRWRHTIVVAAAAAAGVIALQVLSACANRGVPGWPDRATELAWYFGGRDERLSWSTHWHVLVRIGKQAVTLPGFALAVVAAFSTNVREPLRLVCSWSVAAIASSLLFLHVNAVHSYYQLPCVPPLALAAGHGLVLVVRAVAAAVARPRPTMPAVRATLAAATAIALLVLTAWQSTKYLARLDATDTAPLRAAGAFVAAHTSPDDVVWFGTVAHDDNPAYLFFAQRRGRNVTLAELPALPPPPARPAPGTASPRVVLYVPPGVTSVAASRDNRWQPLAAGGDGALFVPSAR